MKIDSTVLDATIVNVSTRQVGARQSTLWEVETQEGTKWVTFKADIGNLASNNKGAKVDMDVSIESKDTFTNYYVNAIRVKTPAAQPQAEASSDIAELIRRAQGAAEQKQEMSFAEFGAHDREKETRRNESIHRQTAAKVAVQLSQTPTEFWSNVEDLVRYFGTGATPFSQTKGNPAQAPQQQDYGLPTHAGPEPDRYQHSDADAPADDIPF